MMYDFHYPLGQAKLNEDTANCRAKQCSMGVGVTETAVPWLSFFVPPVLPCPIFSVQTRGLKTAMPLEVPSQSINQELLKVETILSHQYVNGWATTSIRALICASLTHTPSAFPGIAMMKEKAGTFIRSIWHFREVKWRGHKLTEYEKCFQKEPSEEFHWWKLMSKMVGVKYAGIRDSDKALFSCWHVNSILASPSFIES